jgi:hypothetical protein
MQQKDEKWQSTFEAAKELLEKQNKSAAPDRGETNRQAADGIDIGDIYNGK